MRLPAAEAIMSVAIPGFFVLMAIELAAGARLRRPVYRLNDAINSIGLGMLSQVIGVFTKALIVGIHAWAVQRFALFALPADSPVAWIGALLLYDFCYYWQHRAGHEVGILWAAHVVHHQSERYNLATALRQSGSGALLGWVFLGETLPPLALVGIALTCAGVMLAILFGKRPGQSARLESVKGPLWIGVALGLGAALGQSLGSIIARPVMAAGVDPFAASMLRVGVAAACLSVVMLLPFETVKPRNTLTLKVLGQTALTGILAMGLGMTLLLYALSGGKVGIVSTLSATSPVLILPLLWLTTGERPAHGAWAGALLVAAGMTVLFLGK